jgi:poly-gamma-glutamate synthesis protein (capsule biosynthesis protein)
MYKYDLRLCRCRVSNLGNAAERKPVSLVTLFLAGDVMTGRGIDQALAAPGNPRLFEPYVRDARVYVELAERVHGPIERPLAPHEIWGAALTLLDERAADARIANLETSVTVADDHARDKSIHYRMNPANVACLRAPKLDCCVLANNHVLDWGTTGLVETLETLQAAGIATAGAGYSFADAALPARLELPSGQRILVFARGSTTSGIPLAWRAQAGRPGVQLLDDLSAASARRLAGTIERVRKAGDVVVVSVHWGGNWGYAIPPEQREFAHALLDSGVVDVIYGHSSHHAKGIEVYRGKPIIYGCGDFLNDYEGISGHREYRGDLALAYFVTIDSDRGTLAALNVVPLQMHRFRLRQAARADAEWLQAMLDREGRSLGTTAELALNGNELVLRWREPAVAERRAG